MNNGSTNDSVRLTESQASISKKLLAGRLAANPVTQFPGTVPSSLHAAYGIQSASIESWPDKVAGWKVAGVPVDLRKLCGAEKIAGPIFATSVIRARPRTISICPVYRGGFAAVEAEIVLQLGTAITPATELPDDLSLIGAVNSAYIGAELAGSPMAMINDLGPYAVVSDFGNNFGLVVGEPIPNWASSLQKPIAVTTTIDNVVAGQAVVESVLANPMTALRFLVGLCRQRGITLAAGTFVSTGAITGVHRIDTGNSCRVEYSGFEPMEFQFVHAQPK